MNQIRRTHAIITIDPGSRLARIELPTGRTIHRPTQADAETYCSERGIPTLTPYTPPTLASAINAARRRTRRRR